MFCRITKLECARVGKGDPCPLAQDARLTVVLEDFCVFQCEEDEGADDDLPP